MDKKNPMMTGKANLKKVSSESITAEALATDNKQRTADQNKNCYHVNLELIDYREARKLQTELVEARIRNVIPSDIVLFLEHPPVFTLGRRGGAENLLISGSYLEKSGISVVPAERGGSLTYHGPGQLVVYPIMDLHVARIAVVEFVEKLEEVMLQTVALWGISAERNPANRGIWVDHKKMGSIGIALRKGVSFHGLALNVNLDLSPFSWIQPCGLPDVRMTSMKQESSREISMSAVRESVKEVFEFVFDIRLVASSRAALRRVLGNQKDEQITRHQTLNTKHQ